MDFLFERLSPPHIAIRDPIERTRLAVQRQIQWLVGTREWRAEQEGTALLDVAMPDLPSLSADGPHLQRYVARLHKLISLYEPRLQQVDIQLKVTGKALAPFVVIVSGIIRRDDREEALRFEYEPGPRQTR